jgi:hypothetical protein
MRERERERETWLEGKQSVLEQKERLFVYKDVILITSRLGQQHFGYFPTTVVLARR